MDNKAKELKETLKNTLVEELHIDETEDEIIIEITTILSSQKVYYQIIFKGKEEIYDFHTKSSLDLIEKYDNKFQIIGGLGKGSRMRDMIDFLKVNKFESLVEAIDISKIPFEGDK